MVVDLVDRNQSINGHTITFGWLLDSLRENDEEYQKEYGHRCVKQINVVDIANSNGIVSGIYRCTLSFNDTKDSNDIYTTILKIPKTNTSITSKNDDDMQKNINQNFVDIHLSECKFYNDIAPILDVPLPKVYKTLEWIIGKQDGCIHMEDLTMKGKNLSFFEGINLTQIKKVIRHLAHMHKNILKADLALWKGKYPTNPEGFGHFIDMLLPQIDVFMGKCKRKDAFNKIFPKLEKIIRNKNLYTYGYIEIGKELKIEHVIVHGDLHLGNMMWAINENGDLQNEVAAFIDWQIIYEGSPMNDLARFLTMCPSGVVRRQAEEFAIDFYLKCLTEEFNGDSSKVPYTREQLEISYNYVFLGHILFLISAAIFFHVEESDEADKRILEAYWDNAELKILMACEDAVRLLENEMKDVLKKFTSD